MFITRMFLLLSTTYFIALPIKAETENIGDRELQRQQQRQQAIESQLSPSSPDVRLIPDLQFTEPNAVKDDICFEIESIELQGADSLPQKNQISKRIDQITGQCIGISGIRGLMSDLQNIWIAKGLITTRVLAPQQDLSSGNLKLIVLPGVLNEVKLAGAGQVNLDTAIPATSKKPLDLRDIEQGLENLQRFPTVNANFRIVPGVRPGESDVVVDWQQTKKWRVALSANDAGSESTGRNQVNATVYLDNALGLSELFYLSRGVDLHADEERSSDTATAHFSIPLGYWNLGFTSNRYEYLQTIAGQVQNIEFSGESRSHTVNLSRVIERTNRSKTSIDLAIGSRSSNNFVDGVEVEIQRRDTAYWSLGINNRLFLGNATLNSQFNFRKGTRWFGAQPAPEEATGDATALSDIYNLNVSLQLPFTALSQRLRWSARFNGQWTDTPLTPQDQITIGSRYTVRGYDGRFSLSADRGWYLQNDLAWQIPTTQAELFWGVDYGEVSGDGSELLIGRHLAGTILGIKGNWKGLSYQFFAGKPLSKPSGFVADNSVLGFDLNWSF